MKKIMKLGIFVLFLLITFFVNFATLGTHLIECGFQHWPCYSEGFDSSVFTAYPNFFVKASCGGFNGDICSPAHFSVNVLIFDIIFALILLCITLGIISLFYKRAIKAKNAKSK